MTKKEIQDLFRAVAIDSLQAERAYSNSEKTRVYKNIKKITKNLKTITESL